MTSGTPFLKWAGGKRWLAQALTPLLEGEGGRYFEPFIGSGAVFFASKPRGAVLSDRNIELINTYRQVRDRPRVVIAELTDLAMDSDVFATVRDKWDTGGVQGAARMIYLNRAAYNGLYRVNRNGRFNVPFGCKPGTTACDRAQIRQASAALKGAKLLADDFDRVLRGVCRGDTVYADPPYAAKGGATFTRYAVGGFGWPDQERVASCLSRAARMGANVICSNALDADILSLYSGNDFVAFGLKRVSNMAANSARRGFCSEALIVSRSLIGKLRARGDQDAWCRLDPELIMLSRSRNT